MSERKPPGSRAWERAEVLVPKLAGPDPELVSDGAGLPFPPAALAGPAVALNPNDAAVMVLLAEIRGDQPKLLKPWRRATPEPLTEAETARAAADLAGWRELARVDEDEALFAKGRPPRLLTVAVRRHPKRNEWSILAVTRERPLRAARRDERVRASSWRLDPTYEPDPDDTELRILVTEQRRSGGKFAHGRFLAPDLHLTEDELVLTMFISPLPVMGVQGANPETPVRIALPEPIGDRLLVDGALYELDGS